MRVLFNYEELGILGRGGDGGGGGGGGDVAAQEAASFGVSQQTAANINQNGCMAPSNAPNTGMYAACNTLQNGLCLAADFAPVGSGSLQSLASAIGEACRTGVTNVLSTDPANRENKEPGLQGGIGGPAQSISYDSN
jgi:hypothetical protein